ncbi:MAG: GNAT family N-acetyltransferase [Chloroflexota bacterium]
MDEPTVRRLSANPTADVATWAGVRELCCRTGDNGRPITRERWEFFPRIWIDPYEKLLPHWTYVAEMEGAVVGYLTGCPDTRRFFRRRAWRVTLPLLSQIFCGRYRHTPGTGAYVRRALGIDKSAEQRFPPALYRSIARDYPAHLHINIEAGFRRSGLGRRLVESYLADLQRASVEGVHLFCATDPLPFYRRLGFQVLDSVDLRGARVFALGRRL